MSRLHARGTVHGPRRQSVVVPGPAGALYGCQSAAAAGDANGIRAAARADATDLSPAPDVTPARDTDADGNPTVRVTAIYTFKTITNYPGIPSATTLTRTVVMRVIPP